MLSIQLLLMNGEIDYVRIQTDKLIKLRTNYPTWDIP